MNIPEELLKKYHMQTLDGYKQDFSEDMGDTEVEIMFRETFLIQTKTVIDQMVEGAMKTEDCADELYWREVARQELATLKGEEAAETGDRKTLEQRATQVEADMTFIAMMSDIELEE